MKAAAAPAVFKTPAAFRRWLRAHHQTATELVVRLYKVQARDQGLGYAEALDEALCYGWIDGVRHGLDADSFSIRFTPRKPRSIWSRVNVAHVKRLQGAGRMAPAGLRAFAARTEARTGVYSFERAAIKLSAPFEKHFRSNRTAWSYFQDQAPGYQRVSIFLVMSAKRAETRERRLDTLIACSAKGTKIPALLGRTPASR